MEKKIFLIFIALLLLIPSFLTNTKKDYFSDVDNRKLVEYSGLESLDEYVNDRIGLREQMMFIYQNFNYHILGLIPHPDYELGKNDEIFPYVLPNQEYDDFKKLFVETVVKMKDYCDSHDVAFYVLFDPNKASVYEEFLNDGINYDRSWAVTLLNQLKENDVKVCDNYEYFRQIKNEIKIYNSKDDVAHWNDMGAYLGINNLLRLIQKDFPEIEENEYDDMHVEEYFKRFIDNTNIVINEETQIISPQGDYNESDNYLLERQTIKIDQTFANFNHYINTKEENINKPKMLIFSGSYINGRNHYGLIAQQFKELIMVHNYRNILNLPYYENLFKPDIVVFDFAEFVVADYFFPTEKMNDLSFPSNINLDNNLKEENLGKLSTNIYNEIFQEFYIESTVNGDAYLLIDDKIYDLIWDNDHYYLITLISNIKNHKYRLIIVSDEVYYQDFD